MHSLAWPPHTHALQKNVPNLWC